ncbi:hypothetical protein CTAYLR_001331 [Chrysophaeum taylorii]|uniref:Aminoglycoside phosphotransferase domain-containing protein n=1 Tax=Chrysophaeum taylorii TaxID=2483200 RepID=A0AAD7U5A7_9STRA|nr:hypothetical protein CTAYLR_001331 [Chrysophaeum taylorii]
MAGFDKASVDVAEVLGIDGVASELGVHGEAVKLQNGGCAANYLIGDDVVVKAVVGPDARELAALQVRVLEAVAGTRVGPRPIAGPCACETTRGAGWAIAMERAPGEAANVLEREGKVSKAAACGAIGDALGTLHAANLFVDEATNLGDPRFLERFLRVDGEVEVELSKGSADDPFVGWVRADDWRRLKKVRAALARTDIPAGLLHGDPYTDNVLLVVDDGTVASSKLVDWEDACIGPLCYDVACALVAAAFGGREGFEVSVAKKLLEAYTRRRKMDETEVRALPDLMFANAVACALYRWHQFHVVDPEAPAAAKAAHLEMQAIATKIENEKFLLDDDLLLLLGNSSTER